MNMLVALQAIRVLGLLGALDPWKHKVHLGQIDSAGDSGAVLSQSDTKTEQDSAQSGKYLLSSYLKHNCQYHMNMKHLDRAH